MDKEELEELKDFTIDISDIDELALGLEVCSKKSSMVIQEFADTIIQLQQENQELKIELSGYRQAILKDKEMLGLKEENDKLKKQLYQDYLEEENKKYKNQQKEFIEYINKTIEELESDDVDDEEMKGYLIQRIDTFKENLSKFKEIIGVSDEKK